MSASESFPNCTAGFQLAQQSEQTPTPTATHLPRPHRIQSLRTLPPLGHCEPPKPLRQSAPQRFMTSIRFFSITPLFKDSYIKRTPRFPKTFLLC